MTIQDFIQNKAAARRLCLENDISYLGLFGSYARNEPDPKSDVDLLVDFGETKSLFEIMRIKMALEAKLNREVDLVLKDDIKNLIKPYIQKDLITLYESEKGR